MRNILAPLLISGIVFGSIAFGGQPAQQPGGPATQSAGSAQQALPADMPKMLVIRAHQDKSGQDEDITIFVLDRLVQVKDATSAEALAKDLETQASAPLEEFNSSVTPRTIQQLFIITDSGDSKSVSWRPRWHFFNRGVYGYGARPFFGYRYPGYYGNYGYYANNVAYPYGYNNFYYPYGGYNYYYYYNPYYRWW